MEIQDSLSNHLLVLGDEIQTAELAELLGHTNWTYSHAQSPGEVLSMVRRGECPDVLVIAPARELRNYVELCRTLKLQTPNALVPVIFVLTSELPEDRVAIYQAGADDCIGLPTSRDELILRILKAIRAARAIDSLEDATAIITALANAIEGKDSYTCGHVERVATYAVEIGKSLGLGPVDLATLRTGALLHDIGKVTVPDQILNKCGGLADEEMEVIKRHPLVGFSILESMRTFQAIRPIVRWHHERPNGTGYPDGIGGDELPLLPRIVTVADCFDALTSDRPYRLALSLDRCQAILESDAECGNLDADVVRALMRILGRGAALQPAASAGEGLQLPLLAAEFLA
jgi:putative two-component system response regulator